MSYLTSPLISAAVTSRDRRIRLAMFVVWLLLVAWFLAAHVVWRDEVRALSLALSGSNVREMLRNVHGEGHPALWYLILRGAHTLLPVREVLPAAGAIFGIAAMALFVFRAPFRIAIVGFVLFSLFGVFEYVVVARNYGISALVMFGVAALYPRIKNSLWFGFALALLANTNVPSCFLAAGLLLYRFVELFMEERESRKAWLVFTGNALLALAGAYLCFRTVYPTFNDAAVSAHYGAPTSTKILAALFDYKKGFTQSGIPGFQPLILFLSCFAFVQRPAALAAALFGFLSLKLFFFLVYLSYYRHEALFLVYLLSLHWIVAAQPGAAWDKRRWTDVVRIGGLWLTVHILVVQTILLARPIAQRVEGIPYSRSAEVAEMLEHPSLRGAIVMADPDTMLEPLPYYVDNQLWFLRQQRFGKVVKLARDARHVLTLDDILADADRLHKASGRPIVFLTRLRLRTYPDTVSMMMFNDVTVLNPQSVARFHRSTRLVARLRPAGTDEEYDVYVYPG